MKKLSFKNFFDGVEFLPQNDVLEAQEKPKGNFAKNVFFFGGGKLAYLVKALNHKQGYNSEVAIINKENASCIA